LEIELVAVPGAVSLFKREADLAVMISPPEKGRFKTRRLSVALVADERFGGRWAEAS